MDESKLSIFFLGKTGCDTNIGVESSQINFYISGADGHVKTRAPIEARVPGVWSKFKGVEDQKHVTFECD